MAVQLRVRAHRRRARPWRWYAGTRRRSAPVLAPPRPRLRSGAARSPPSRSCARSPTRRRCGGPARWPGARCSSPSAHVDRHRLRGAERHVDPAASAAAAPACRSQRPDLGCLPSISAMKSRPSTTAALDPKAGERVRRGEPAAGCLRGLATWRQVVVAALGLRRSCPPDIGHSRRPSRHRCWMRSSSLLMTARPAKRPGNCGTAPLHARYRPQVAPTGQRVSERPCRQSRRATRRRSRRLRRS